MWGVPLAALSLSAFVLGALFHHQALNAAATEAARKELGSCCHPAPAETGKTSESGEKEGRAKAALLAGLALLGAAVAPAALASGESGQNAVRPNDPAPPDRSTPGI
jgi:hypothetical protein